MPHPSDSLAQSQHQFDQIADQVYRENPTWWPYGLSRRHLDGGAWLVKTSAGQPAGFVGLQLRAGEKPRERVGYYAVGLLPQYRGTGLAKKALTHMLSETRHLYDRVGAYVVPGNIASERLAQKLSVPVTPLVKKARTVPAWVTGKVMSALGMGLTVPTAMDMYIHKGRFGDVLDFGKWEPDRQADFIMNALAGTAGGGLMRSGISRQGINKSLFGGGASLALGLPYLKPSAARLPSMMEAKTQDLKRGGGGQYGIDPMTLLKVVGGATALGLGGWGVKHLVDEMRLKREQEAEQLKGRVRVTLPTKNPGDAETQVDMPIREFNFSNPIQQNLRRDTTRRLRAEVAHRTYPKGVRPDNAEHVEEEDA